MKIKKSGSSHFQRLWTYSDNIVQINQNYEKFLLSNENLEKENLKNEMYVFKKRVNF